MTKRRWFLLALLAVAAAILAAVAAASSGSGPSGLAKALAAKNAHAKQLFKHQGVVGVGVGAENGKADIVVLTARSGVTGIPAKLDGVNVVVRVSGPIKATALAATQAKPFNPATFIERPVPIGVSTGRDDECSAGTIGAKVSGGGHTYALSVNHVYAQENNGDVGDNILQPGRYDAKPKCSYSTDFDFATLSDFVPIDFTSLEDGGENTVDAAIAELNNSSDLLESTPDGGYGTPDSTPVTATMDMAVQKYGRGSRLTHGTVCIVAAEINVGYSSGVAGFVDQIGVCGYHGRFSASGDSGSLVVTDNESANPVGLLFAGGGPYTFANPIGDVLSGLGVSIDGS